MNDLFGNNNQKSMVSTAGLVVVLDDTPGKEQINISSPDMTNRITIFVSDNVIQIMSGGNVRIDAPKGNIMIRAGGNLILEAGGFITAQSGLDSSSNDGSFQVTSRDEVRVESTNKDINLIAQDGVAVVSNGSDITVSAKNMGNISLNADGKLSTQAARGLDLEGASVAIKATSGGTVDIDAGPSPCIIKGMPVSIN